MFLLSRHHCCCFSLVPSLRKAMLKKEKRQAQLRVLSSFTPLNSYKYFLIHRSTDIDLLRYLIDKAQQTQYFAIDTESDLFTSRPALIQIELIHQQLSTVILIEVCHLPSRQHSLPFRLIQSIFTYMLR